MHLDMAGVEADGIFNHSLIRPQLHALHDAGKKDSKSYGSKSNQRSALIAPDITPGY